MKDVASYYRGLEREYRRLLPELLRGQDAAAIHELRLTIKKIRAAYHLLAFADPEFDPRRQFRNYEHIFKACGQVRDLDITLEIIAGFPNTLQAEDAERIRSLLVKHRTVRSAELRTAIEQFGFKDEAGAVHIERLLSAKPVQERGAEFLSELLHRIKSQIKKRQTDERLHGIRKLCKDYLYLAGTDGPPGADLKRLDALQKIIGKWHDLVIAEETVVGISEKDDGFPRLLHSLGKEEKKLKRKAIAQLRN